MQIQSRKIYGIYSTLIINPIYLSEIKGTT